MRKGRKRVVGTSIESYVVAERFERALKLIRSALAEMDLDVAAEFDSAVKREGQTAHHEKPPRTLLVDCPLLNFEALALDRAAAVFFPLHVLVAPLGERTRVSIVDLPRLLDARLPVGAEDPIERLAARIRMALESVAEKPGNTR